VQGLVDGDLDLGLRVLGQRDVVNGADRLTADQHLVAGHELATGLEQELVLGPVVAAEQSQHDEHRGNDQRSEDRDPYQDATHTSGFRLLALHSGTQRASLLSSH
jgi:hypothetical protein